MYELLSEKEDLMKAELEREADKILEEIENNLKKTSDEMSSLEHAIRSLQDNDDLHEASKLLKSIEAALDWPDLTDDDPPAEQPLPCAGEAKHQENAKDGNKNDDLPSPGDPHRGPDRSPQTAALTPGAGGRGLQG